MNYPLSYHKAFGWIIAHGATGRHRKYGRKLIAAALRDMRVRSHTAARITHRDLLFIAGRMPIKGKLT